MTNLTLLETKEELVAHLKRNGIRVKSATSSSFSMGNAIRIEIDPAQKLTPEQEIVVRRARCDYEFGSFDGMTDSYNYKDGHKVVCSDGLARSPGAKYVHITHRYDPDAPNAEQKARYRKNRLALKAELRPGRKFLFSSDKQPDPTVREVLSKHSTFWELSSPTGRPSRMTLPTDLQVEELSPHRYHVTYWPGNRAVYDFTLEP